MTLSTIVWITLTAAVATYLTRIGGHVVLSRFRRIHPRVEAGLNAVPAAVLSAIVAPALLTGGPVELLALGAAAVGSLRFGLFGALAAGCGLLIAIRAFSG